MLINRNLILLALCQRLIRYWFVEITFVVISTKLYQVSHGVPYIIEKSIKFLSNEVDIKYVQKKINLKMIQQNRNVASVGHVDREFGVLSYKNLP